LLGYYERLDEYNDDDPYPISVLGKIIPSNKLRGYFTSEFFYYYQFYARMKRLGNPFNCGWLDWPRWCVQIEMAFDAAHDEVKAYHQIKQAEDYERAAAVRAARRR
jgi:hypothetical protein